MSTILTFERPRAKKQAIATEILKMRKMGPLKNGSRWRIVAANSVTPPYLGKKAPLVQKPCSPDNPAWEDEIMFVDPSKDLSAGQIEQFNYAFKKIILPVRNAGVSLNVSEDGTEVTYPPEVDAHVTRVIHDLCHTKDSVALAGLYRMMQVLMASTLEMVQPGAHITVTNAEVNLMVNTAASQECDCPPLALHLETMRKFEKQREKARVEKDRANLRTRMNRERRASRRRPPAEDPNFVAGGRSVRGVRGAYVAPKPKAAKTKKMSAEEKAEADAQAQAAKDELEYWRTVASCVAPVSPEARSMLMGGDLHVPVPKAMAGSAYGLAPDAMPPLGQFYSRRDRLTAGRMNLAAIVDGMVNEDTGKVMAHQSARIQHFFLHVVEEVLKGRPDITHRPTRDAGTHAEQRDAWAVFQDRELRVRVASEIKDAVIANVKYRGGSVAEAPSGDAIDDMFADEPDTDDDLTPAPRPACEIPAHMALDDPGAVVKYFNDAAIITINKIDAWLSAPREEPVDDVRDKLRAAHQRLSAQQAVNAELRQALAARAMTEDAVRANEREYYVDLAYYVACENYDKHVARPAKGIKAARRKDISRAECESRLQQLGPVGFKADRSALEALGIGIDGPGPMHCIKLLPRTTPTAVQQVPAPPGHEMPDLTQPDTQGQPPARPVDAPAAFKRPPRARIESVVAHAIELKDAHRRELEKRDFVLNFGKDPNAREKVG